MNDSEALSLSEDELGLGEVFNRSMGSHIDTSSPRSRASNKSKNKGRVHSPNNNVSEEDEMSNENEEDESDEGNYEEEEDEEDEDEDEVPYNKWFCSLKGNEFFCEVPEDYITDDFNLTGLADVLGSYYDYALDTILGADVSYDEFLNDYQRDIIETSAETLYGLIHARYILTTRGVEQMYEKYQNADFGRCHRVLCQGQPVLPWGQSDVPLNTTVNIFCPNCKEVYFPNSKRQGNIDGAYFGTTFAHLFLMIHPELVPPVYTKSFVPRVYGFKIHSSSPYWNKKS